MNTLPQYGDRLYHIVLKYTLDSKWIFLVSLPLLLPIWRATVSLDQYMLKRQWYFSHKPSLGVANHTCTCQVPIEAKGGHLQLTMVPRPPDLEIFVHINGLTNRWIDRWNRSLYPFFVHACRVIILSISIHCWELQVCDCMQMPWIQAWHSAVIHAAHTILS